MGSLLTNEVASIVKILTGHSLRTLGGWPRGMMGPSVKGPWTQGKPAHVMSSLPERSSRPETDSTHQHSKRQGNSSHSI